MDMYIILQGHSKASKLYFLDTGSSFVAQDLAQPAEC